MFDLNAFLAALRAFLFGHQEQSLYIPIREDDNEEWRNRRDRY